VRAAGPARTKRGGGTTIGAGAGTAPAPDAKAPVPRTDGDRALFSLVLRERIVRGMATSWASSPLPSQRSRLEPLAVGSPGPTGTSPGQSSSIRSQDGPSCRHRISASFWNPLGSRTASMRSAPGDFQGPMTLSSRSRQSDAARPAPQPSSASRGRVRLSLSSIRDPSTWVTASSCRGVPASSGSSGGDDRVDGPIHVLLGRTPARHRDSHVPTTVPRG
jgi:hypothetical protein